MTLSVIVPTYNRAGYLGEAIGSIAAQAIADMEALVVDDGSSDQTGETVEALTARYPQLNLRYIRQEHAGISAARNRGVLSAQGEWIGFLDSDDRWHPQKAEKQLAYLKAHPGCKIVFTRYENYLDGSVSTLSPAQKTIMEGHDQRYLASAFVHRSLFQLNGLFCGQLIVGEDDEWVLRNKLLGVSVDHHVEEALYFRRVHGDNISLDHRGQEKARIGALIALAARNAKMIRSKQRENISPHARV